MSEASVWDDVDWTQINSEIARKIGRTRERVRQKRAALGMCSSRVLLRSRTLEKHNARCEHARAKRASMVGRDDAVRRLLEVADWTLSNGEIALMTGLSSHRVGRFRKEYQTAVTGKHRCARRMSPCDIAACLAHPRERPGKLSARIGFSVHSIRRQRTINDHRI